MNLSACSLLLAATAPGDLPSTLNTNAQISLRGIVPVLLGIAAVLAVVMFWAVYIRKSPRERQRGALLDGESDTGRMSSSGRRRRRRRNRERRPRNPTRAETGGLPPAGAGSGDPTAL
jgi:hypothetical protein